MKKTFTKSLYTLGIICISTCASFAQNIISGPDDADKAPCYENPNVTPLSNEAMWSVLFNYDLFAAVGSNGNAGVCFTGTEFWVSRWQNDTLYRLSPTGTLLQKFTISGVTGTRSLTTDGTFIYAGLNTSSVAKIDIANKTLVSTILAPIPNVRSLTYDPTIPGGGFYASTWGTDITQFDMSGVTANIIAASSHGLTGMYGTAFDNSTVGGPYLWVFDQATSAEKSDIVQINIATQMQTGIIHDVMSDVGLTASDTSGLAGGLFFYSQAGVLTLTGVLQGSPTNRLFGYEVGMTGIGEHMNSDEFITIYPNPVKEMVNINVNKQNNDLVHLQIIDAMGKVVFETNTRGQNNYINCSKYSSGIYFVKTMYDGTIATSKFIKE